MDYKKYQNSRNAAWEMLIDQQVCELPVRISKLCRNIGIEVRTYTANELDGDGKCLISDGKPIILVNNDCTLQRQRFTAAHELGHIVHKHVGTRALVNREPSPEDPPEEHEANVFASRLLAPAIVLRDLNVQSAEDIARLCNISRQASEFRWERLKLLYEREKQFMLERGYSCFGLHPLERQVREQFGEYIKRNKL